MPTILLHTKRKVDTNWNIEHREFAGIPSLGEYVVLSPESPWYETHLVVHTPYKSDCDAEVYVVEALRGRNDIVELVRKAGVME